VKLATLDHDRVPVYLDEDELDTLARHLDSPTPATWTLSTFGTMATKTTKTKDPAREIRALLEIRRSDYRDAAIRYYQQLERETMKDAKDIERRSHEAALKGASSKDPRDQPKEPPKDSGRPPGWSKPVPPSAGVGVFKGKK